MSTPLDALPVTSDSGAVARIRRLFRGKRGDVLILAALLVIAGIYSWIRVERSWGYFRGDVLISYLSYFTEVGNRVKSGDLPDWNPAIFSGMPLAGDPTANWGYLFSLIPFLLVKPMAAFKAYVYMHFLVATASTYLLARVLGLTRIGGAVAGIAFLMGPNFEYAQCCMVRLHLATWLPVGLLAIELGLRSTRAWQRVAAWSTVGIVIAQLIAGYFGKGMYFGVLVLGAYLAYRLLLSGPTSGRPFSNRLIDLCLYGAVMLVLGALFGAVSLLPRLDFLGVSNLAGGSYEGVANTGAIEPPRYSLPGLLSLLLSPQRPTYYLSGSVVVLAIIGVVLARRRFAAPFFALMSLAAMALTLKPNVFHQVVYLLPRFQELHEHDPQIVLALATLGPALLAGSAVTMIEQRLPPRSLVVAAASAVLASGVVYWLLRPRALPGSTRFLTVALLIGGLMVGLALLMHLGRLSARQTQLAQTGVCLALLLIVIVNSNRGIFERIWTGDSSQATPLARAYLDDSPTGDAAAFLLERQAGEGPFRYFGFNPAFLSLDEGAMKINYHSAWEDMLTADLLENNRSMLLTLQDIQGYNPVQEMNYLTYINTLNGQIQEYHETNILPAGLRSPLLPLLNVRYVVIPVEATGPDIDYLTSRYTEVFRNESVRVLEIPEAMPRAWTVHQVQQIADDQLLSTLASGSIDPATTALMAEPPPTLAPVPAGASDQVTITDYQDDEITLSANLASDGMVILSEVYDPGWSVKIDGEAATIHEVNGLLRGIAVPAGEHTIKLVYAPSSIRNGIAISAFTWVLAIMAVLLLWWKEPAEWLRLAGRRQQTAGPDEHAGGPEAEAPA